MGRRLVRLQTSLGVALVSYLLWHGARHWAALGGREHWAASVDALETPLWAVVIAACGAYATLGAFLGLSRSGRAGAATTAGVTASWGLARGVSGALAAGFLLLHLAHVWPDGAGPHLGRFGGYDDLTLAVGRPLNLFAYVLGATSICVHTVLGVDWALGHWLGTRYARVRTVALGATAVACLVAWLAALHLLGYFANGEGLLPGSMWR